jgi:hypothetical protein
MGRFRTRVPFPLWLWRSEPPAELKCKWGAAFRIEKAPWLGSTKGLSRYSHPRPENLVWGLGGAQGLQHIRPRLNARARVLFRAEPFYTLLHLLPLFFEARSRVHALLYV